MSDGSDYVIKSKLLNTYFFSRKDFSAVLCSFLKENVNFKSWRVAAKAESKDNRSPAAAAIVYL